MPIIAFSTHLLALMIFHILCTINNIEHRIYYTISLLLFLLIFRRPGSLSRAIVKILELDCLFTVSR